MKNTDVVTEAFEESDITIDDTLIKLGVCMHIYVSYVSFEVARVACDIDLFKPVCLSVAFNVSEMKMATTYH